MKTYLRLLAFISYLSIVLNAQSLTRSEFQHALDSLCAAPYFDTSVIAIKITDADNDEVIYKINEHLLLHPASNMKILTSCAALYFLPNDYCYTTLIASNGDIRNRVLNGDLVIVGGGDPDLDIPDVDSIIAILKARGINHIKGDLCADVSLFDSLFWGEGWMWDDDASTDAPYLTPLSFHKNMVTVRVEANGRKLDVYCQPNSLYNKIIDESYYRGNENPSVSISREVVKHSDNILIRGNSCGLKAPVTKSLCIIHPELSFLQYLRERLAKAEITLDGGLRISSSPIRTQILGSVKRNIVPVLTNLNKVSDNLSAELTLRIIAAEWLNKRPVGALDGIAFIDSLINDAGYKADNYRIVDGSGVSHYNLVSAEVLHGVLNYFYRTLPEKYEILKSTLPIAGVDGTIRKRMTQSSVKGRIFAKTGTLSGVSCLSGYAESHSGRHYIFSIMMQNHFNRLSKAQSIQDQICAWLVNIDDK